MKKLILRLDDACPKRDIEKWNRIEALLDAYGVKPLVGVIPHCKDPSFDKYPEDLDFWNKRVQNWKKKGWVLAMHGYEHVFHTKDTGINPVNNYSEFAGLSIDVQRDKIRKAINILKTHNIEPQVFFAPAHSFDKNTLEALKKESSIRVISDVPANKSFSRYGMTFVPQQSGKVRALPFAVQTFCYHPNNMNEDAFIELESFLKSHVFSEFPLKQVKRRLSVYDLILMKIYYWKHR